MPQKSSLPINLPLKNCLTALHALNPPEQLPLYMLYEARITNNGTLS